MQITRVVLIGSVIVAATGGVAAAQERAQDYPSRQVNFIVPFAPGGGTDILGRLVGQKLSDRYGKPFPTATPS
jgi:tripartite-type tricarboxylate transporter receptor subunit TctC